MKVAVIGRGFGAHMMKPAFEARGWAVDVIPSRDPDAVKAACEGPFDLIAVHSPPFQHREHVLAAIAAGKDVLCDKPFGASAADAHAMRDAAKAAGVLHFVNFEFRHGKARRQIRELVSSGEIGQLLRISYESHTSYMRKRGYGWLFDAQLGGGWLGAMGSHVIDAVRWIAGSEIADCGGLLRTDLPERADADGAMAPCTAEDAFMVWLSLANGATATLDASSSLPVSLPQRLTLIGSEGAIEMAEEDVVVVRKAGADPRAIDCMEQAQDGVWPALYNWIAAIEQAQASRTQIAPSFDDGVATAEVLDNLKARSTRA